MASTGDERSELVSLDAAAALLGVSWRTVLRWSVEGDLVEHRIGSQCWFARLELLELRARRAQAAATNREAAERARAVATAAGNLDVAPSPAELIAAGQALRDGRPEVAAGVLARARRAGAQRAAEQALG